MKPQRDVWLLALANGGNLLPSDAISRAVKLNVLSGDPQVFPNIFFFRAVILNAPPL
jgi:hypothetical protein